MAEDTEDMGGVSMVEEDKRGETAGDVYKGWEGLEGVSEG